MRRYELMLVIRPMRRRSRPGAPAKRSPGQIAVPAARSSRQPVGRRPPGLPDRPGTASVVHIIHFDAPRDSIADLERTLLITEDVIRHLIVRSSDRLKRRRQATTSRISFGPRLEEDEEAEGEQIDESESEAARPRSTDQVRRASNSLNKAMIIGNSA